MQTHINNLLKQHNITVEWKDNTAGRAWRKIKKVRLSPIKTDITYAIALHEIGHIAGKQGKHRMDKEVNAWIWAKENALHWTITMQKKANNCLTSYITWAKRSKKAHPLNDTHPVYSFIK